MVAKIAFLTLFILARAEDIENQRKGKILNLFSVVRFPNSVCSGGSLNGTCYSAEECSTRGGINGGTCAGGYGVCCTFQLNCGQSSSENCTYFQSSGSEVGQCRIKICPCSDNICQLRLDFQNFVINQPKTTVESVQKINSKLFYDLGQCQTDLFTVTAPGNTAPPGICGTNSGEHMFVDASDMCNDLGFNLGGTGSTITQRSWTIKITQYDCNYDNLAPDGCTQYFYGMTTDLVKTYNFDGGQHLASQNQKICIRRERGFCQICWATTAEGDFETSSALTGAAGVAYHKAYCCSYKSDYAKTATAFDCAKIPSPSKVGGTSFNAGAHGFCGGELGTAGTIVAATVCSKSVPFNIRFLSDLYETNTEMTKVPNGFRLAYTLMGC